MAGERRQVHRWVEPPAGALPPDCIVERRGDGDERHVFLSIEGTTFELRADDAHALGTALIHCAAEVAAEEDGAD